MRETTSTFSEPSSDNTNPSQIASPIIEMLSRLHVLVIGPGLGRDKLMQSTVATVIKAARESNTPLVLDADALWLIQNQPDLVRGYKECVLTPNIVEFKRLAASVGLSEDEMPDTGEAGCEKLAQALGGVTILRKGQVDWISNGEEAIVDDGEGGRKRSSGQGDTLAGSIGTLLAWRDGYHKGLWEVEGNLDRRETLLLAAWGGSAITRECSRLAFGKNGRSMQASDLTEEVSVAFETLIGEKKESNVPRR